jgi:hypothetical protein
MSEQETKTGSFSIGVWGWVWGVFCAVLAALFMLAHDRMTGPPGSALVGVGIGALIGTIGISAGIGWIAWRIGGRRKRGGRIAFAITCFLVVMGQLTQVATYQTDLDALNAIQPQLLRFGAQMNAALEKPDLSKETRAAEIAALDSLFDDKNLTPKARTAMSLVAAIRNQMHVVASNEIDYVIAVNEFQSNEVLKFANLSAGSDLKRRRVACKALLAATLDYAKWANGNVEDFESRLADAHISEDVHRQLMNAARGAFKDRKPALDHLVAAQTAFAGTMIDLFDFLSTGERSWTVSERGKLVFTTDAGLASFQDLARKIDSSSDAVVKAVAELGKVLAPTMPKPQPPAPEQKTL